MRLSLPLAAVAALFSLSGSALAAPAPASLPSVDRSLTASKAVKRSCVANVAGSSGVATTTWQAPMSGYVTTRLAASDRSDWDLTVFDAATRRRLASSQGFGSHEVAQTWVSSGQRLLVQGCLRKGSARTVQASIKFFDVAPPQDLATPQLLKVRYDGNKDLAKISELGLDLTHHIHDGVADVIVYDAKQKDLLKQAGFSFKVDIADLAKHYVDARQQDLAFTRRVGKSALPSGRTTYRTYEDYQSELKAMVEDGKNAGLVRSTVLPQKSVEGRELQGVEIATDVKAKADGRPTYFLVATHHAREWPAAESAMEFAHTLVKGYHAGDERIKKLLSSVRVVIVPLINADGFVESRNSTDPGDEIANNGGPGDVQTVEAIAPPGPFAYRRKNCRGSFPVGTPCVLQYGVDPNRNYGEGWGGNGASANPTGLTYRGSGPWSEPETQAVHEFSQKRQVTNIITLHNVAALVLRPPGRKADGLAPDEPRMKALGARMSKATGYTNQFGWQLYDTSGTTEDWNYAATGAYGYTIEIGPKDGNFHMPYETGVVNEYNGSGRLEGKGLREALMIAAEAAANPEEHAVIKGKAPAGRVLRLRKDFVTKTSDVCQAALDEPAVPEVCEAKSGVIEIPDFLDTTTVVPASGAFEWHVNPSTRPFVGARRERGELLDPKVEEFGPEPGDPQTTPGALESDDGQPHHVDREFTVTKDEPTEAISVTLEWTSPEDYDMEVYFKEGDELVQVGSSGQPPGLPELAEFDAEPGTYVLRVVNYAATGNTWHATVSRAQRAPDKVTIGKKEAWTLSCESRDGKTVYAKQKVTVDRGQVAEVKNVCGKQAGAKPNKKKAKAKCLKRAKKIKKAKKRKAAIKRCNKKYARKK